MICQSCGRANELGAKFCKGCGAPLASDEGTQQNNSYQPGAGYQKYAESVWNAAEYVCWNNKNDKERI